MINNVILPRRLPGISGKVMSGVLALAIVSSGVGVYRFRAAHSAGSVSYSTATVQRGTISSSVTATGPISAASAVPLNFKSSGKLASINVKVGDQVQAGQVLAALDMSDLQAQVQQAQATLASAQAAYNKAAAGPTATSVAASQASVDAAKTQLGSAQAALQAAQAVAAKDVAAAQQALDDAQKNLQAVQAQANATLAADNTAVANAQQSLADAQKVAQSAPAVVAQSIEKAKDQLYADQVADDAAVGR
ncbi:MAG TPA: biotin/lipoyl-binding protein, partial [Chloroflexota bacterium]|nr:biotin/lipoyl-binding protein [Chloroflexota bacterium]